MNLWRCSLHEKSSRGEDRRGLVATFDTFAALSLRDGGTCSGDRGGRPLGGEGSPRKELSGNWRFTRSYAPACSWGFGRTPAAPTHHCLTWGPSQQLCGLLASPLPASPGPFTAAPGTSLKCKSDRVTPLCKMPQLVPIISLRATKP